MKGVLNLGKVFNVKIEIHWTFIFILAWVIFSELESGGTLQNALMNTIFILLLFVCVVCHEFGHILIARKFGVATKKITLLPIGGVASMETIPENPKQELWIAIAGPAVNLAIALILLLFINLSVFIDSNPDQIKELVGHINLNNLVIYLFSANIMLALFNFIPAFPMDGGRVLRALLAMKMDRVTATSIASGIGQFLALVFVFLGILYNPFLILIALFIFFGAYSENKMVEQLALVKGHKVREAMLTNISILKPENTIEDVIELLLSGTEKNFVVVHNSAIAGILHHKDIISNSKNKDLPIEKVLTTSFKTIAIDSDLKEVFKLINTEKTDFFAVTDKDKLVGAIDLSNLSEFMLIQSNLITR
ncbi:site-2 protease family protein [Aquimarina sp. MMG016]|uniref:site-2 protease family protein n=1 Tax=Aquimarina sp. MMG016 TaxID=2822690 RepID=UPI001B3A3891|nr:site-2 protease family protein [Aquimarina sp. MMG016]MBQ4819662.1 site-2 protease family protein [Aquimarina sp. MMG016]